MSQRTVLVTQDKTPSTSAYLPYADAHVAIGKERSTLIVQVMATDAQVHIQVAFLKLKVQVDAISYETVLTPDEILYLKTAHGNDNVRIDVDHETRVVIETGDGDDNIVVNNTSQGTGERIGRLVVDAGTGNDQVSVSGLEEAEIDGGLGDDDITSDATYSMLYAGPGTDHLTIRTGKAVIEAMSGTNIISNGPLDDRIYGHAHSVIPVDGLDAPLLLEAWDTPLPHDYAKTFPIQGDAAYVSKITRLLNLLKSSQTASVLLADLVARQAEVTLRYTSELDNAHTRTSEWRRDPRVRNGRRGDAILQCTIDFNPLINVHGEHALIALYHELCHAWNVATGSRLGDAEQQAVGLDSGVAFDFDDDPATPPTNTNPYPFNENALRHELGLPPRLEY